MSENDVDRIKDLSLKFPDVNFIFDRRSDFLIEREDVLGRDKDLFNRSLFLYSGGRMINSAEWEIGWCIGNPEVNQFIKVYVEWMTFNPSIPAQIAFRSLFNDFNKLENNHTILDN